jgi:hypothetical protein
MPDPTTSSQVRVRLALGLNFIPGASDNLALDEGPSTTIEESALDNVVAMTDQYRWLAARAADTSMTLDPGPYLGTQGYATQPFANFLNGLLAQMQDPNVTYTAALFIGWHVIIDGRWVQQDGHIFKLMANGKPFTQAARLNGVDYHVELLISTEVLE